MNRQLPFYEIFDALRRNGFALGIDEYKDFIKALFKHDIYTSSETGFKREEVLDICKTLWLKPGQVPWVFEQIFNRHYEQDFVAKDTPMKQDGDKTGSPFADPLREPVAEKETAEKVKRNNAPEPVETLLDTRTAGTSLKDLSRFRLVFNGGQEGLQHFRKENAVTAQRLFLFSDNYFPVTNREVQQFFSGLPERKARRGNTEIDIDATIQSIAQNGYLSGAIYKKEEEIVNQLLIFHDHKGSMTAFEGLSDLITRAANKLFATTYYFQNVISDKVYKDKEHKSAVDIRTLVQFFREKKVMILIVSDAGAARMSNSTGRVKASVRMLRQLEKISARIAWINPLPPCEEVEPGKKLERWERSAAGRIAEFVPMFYADWNGIHDAVEVLKGRSLKIIE